MRKKLAISCSIFLLVGLSYLLYIRDCYNLVSHEEVLAVRKKLEILSPQEKQDLAFFIDEIISFDPYPYTLVEYKPMSICNVFVEDPGDLDPDWSETFHRPRHQKEMR